MKIKLKDFDAKKFLIEKGERVGLYVAAGLMGLMLLFGLKSVLTSSANANASNLKKLNDDKLSLIARSEPSGKPEEGKPADPKTEYGKLATPDARVMSKVELDAVDPGKWVLATGDFFAPGKVPIDKRLRPVVKAPVEFKSAVALAQLDAYRVDFEDERIMVLEGAGTGKGTDPFRDQRSQAGGFFNSMMQNRQTGGGKGSGGSMGSGPMSGMMSGMKGGGGRLPGGLGGTSAEAKTKWVKFDELEKLQGAKPVEDIDPERIAVVVGSLPYKEQLEEFRQKLRFKTLPDLFSDASSLPAFTGIDVMRAEILPGKAEDDAKYETVPITQAVQRLILLSGERFEEDPPELEPVSFDGLVMDRPKQFRDGQYPKIEMDLKHIEETLAALKNAKEALVVKPKNRFTDSDFDPFNRTGRGRQDNKGTSGPETPGTPQMLKKKGSGSSNPTGSPTGDQQLIIPEYCLVRFLDPTIKPGKTYKYKLRIRMANPNYKHPNVAWESLADDKEITSDWVDVSDKVIVPPEVLYYAVDMRTVAQQEKRPDADLRAFLNKSPPGPGQVAVQVHRWLETITPDANLTYPVGDWVIAERLLFNRGEFMTGKDRVEVPIRDVVQDKFILAISRGMRRTERRIEVAFGSGGGADPILVDFQGGLIEYNQFAGMKDDKPDYTLIRDKAPVELVLMSPDGKLHVHDGDADMNDKERVARYRAWKDRIKEIKEEGSRPPTEKTSPFAPTGK